MANEVSRLELISMDPKDLGLGEVVHGVSQMVSIQQYADFIEQTSKQVSEQLPMVSFSGLGDVLAYRDTINNILPRWLDELNRREKEYRR